MRQILGFNIILIHRFTLLQITNCAQKRLKTKTDFNMTPLSFHADVQRTSGIMNYDDFFEKFLRIVRKILLDIITARAY